MKFLCILCVLCGASVFSPALDREAFTIAKYDLQIQLDPQQHRLGARGKLTIRNDSAQPQKNVALQISSSLHWRAIRVEGKPVQYVSQPYVSDIDHTGALSEAIVTLPAEIKPKDSVELEIGYEGVTPQDATRLTRIGVPEEIAKHSSWDQINPTFTAVRGAGYVAWYPITTESADFSDGNSLFEVIDRWKARAAASEFKAALNIHSEGGEEPTLLCGANSGLTEHTGVSWIASALCDYKRLGTITPTFAAANYQPQRNQPLILFSLPGHEVGAVTYSHAFDPAMKFVSGWFGQPTTTVAIADFADPNSAPFESGTLLMASMATEDAKLAGMNVVHELVHSAVPSPRPWVYEGLAHFAEALYRQDQGGRDAALDLLQSHLAPLLDAEKDVSAALQKNVAQKNAAPQTIGQPLATTFDETYYRTKAAYVWWMLRDMIGDDALKQTISKYRADIDNDNADEKDPKYLEHLVEAAAKRDLGWFFNDWVYKDRALPDIRVQTAHPWKTDKGANLITVTFENRGDAGAEIPFTVIAEGGNVYQRIEVRAKATATTRIELTGPASEIRINDGSVPQMNQKDNVFQVPAPSETPAQ
jgi:hypothetical protein